MLIRRTPNNVERIINEWNRSIADNNFNITLDVHENEEGYTIIADVPGVNSEDIDIRLHDDVLTITAEHSEEKSGERGNVILKERRSGKASRSLRFPVNVNTDAVSADYSDGVLTLTVPKAEEVKPRRIEINHA